ncbi:MAG: type II toxin-antitoxin system VapC family toxin [Actinomycetia bacterium]|nr:type II toxin-antitoxin system VapC family toxin [Actinomycetes bacterium]
MTAVIDASALSEIVADTSAAAAILRALRAHAGDLHIPHLAVIETTSVLRGWTRSGQLDPQRAEQALADLEAFPATRWPADPLLPRIWQLRDNLSAYDATYLALAESLDAILITRDARLRRAAAGLTPTTITLPEGQRDAADPAHPSAETVGAEPVGEQRVENADPAR